MGLVHMKPKVILIKLTNGMEAKISEDDLSLVSGRVWRYHKKPSDRTGYVFCLEPTGERYKSAGTRSIGNKKYKRVWMHRLIVGKHSGLIVDHINMDGLDNRRENLRLSTPSENQYNRGVHSHKRSKGNKGVSWVRDRRGVAKYCIARITVNKKRIYLGKFDSEIDANLAYEKAAKEYHGQFCRLK